jgi:hypothetical protein
MNIEISMISAAADGSVFGAAWYGPSAGVYEYDTADQVWISRNELPPDSKTTLNGIWAGSNEEVWAMGGGESGEPPKLFRWDSEEDGWVEISRPVGDDHSAQPIVGSDGTVWLYTMMLDGPEDKALWQYVESNWVPVENSDAASLWMVIIASADSIWAVKNDGQSNIYRYAPTGWQELPGPAVESGWNSLHLSSIGVGADGTMLVSGTLYNSPSDWQYGVWQRASDGSQWTKLPQPEHNQIGYVAAGSATNIWGIGYQGQTGIYQWSVASGQWQGVITSDVPAAQAIAKIQTQVNNMISLTDHYHDYLQDNVLELYSLMQVEATDTGQVLATNLIRLSFKAVGAAPFPGAGAVSGVMGGIFDWVVSDHSGDLNVTFANVWARLSKNFLYLRTQLSNIHSAVNEYWSDQYTNPFSGEVVKVADLFESNMPADGKAFNDLLLQVLHAGKYSLWQQVLPTKWHKVSLINPPVMPFNSKADVDAFIESYVNKNENYYLVAYQQGGKWYTNEWWLGYGPFPIGHHEAPAQLCETLFTDDGLGNVVRTDAITTRADVFTNWDLQDQKVVMPPPPGQRLHKTQEKALSMGAAASGLWK